jgi:hypothetical protein
MSEQDTASSARVARSLNSADTVILAAIATDIAITVIGIKTVTVGPKVKLVTHSKEAK